MSERESCRRKAKFELHFFVTCLELGRILPLSLPFLNIVCTKERTKQKVCLVSCTTHMCICASLNSFCVHVCMRVHVRRSMASGFNREDRRGKNPEKQRPSSKRKTRNLPPPSACHALRQKREVTFWPLLCSALYSAQGRTHLFIIQTPTLALKKLKNTHCRWFCRHEALKVN